MENLAELWPVHMHVDYVRVYQDPALKNIGCDPDEVNDYDSALSDCNRR